MTETTLAPGVLEPPTGLTSPLSLILDEGRTGRPGLEEALFLSFTADLGFFEEVVLGVAQATGARVTVAGDVAMARNDPRSVRRAGRSYLAGLAYAHGAAFHPKLVVLAGAEHATIALGSGNTTLSGWQANAELWTVLRVNSEQSPAVLPDLSAWLRDVPDKVEFSAGVPQALGRVAALLDRLHHGRTPTAPQVRFINSLHAPLINQLPHGPVDELAVFAPFHDQRSQALRQLLERMRPRRFTLSYQPGLTDLDGPSVAALVQEYDGRVISDHDQRYRHGKLIEWASQGQRWALTGSPNLSAAALLRSQGDGGNCELGIITPIPTTLLPDGTDEPAARLRTAASLPRPIANHGPLLLGALRVPDGLDISLARPLTAPAYLQLSQAATPPETWERLADVPPAQTTLTVTASADAGSRVRLAVLDNDGLPRFGNIVFVVDPDCALRRLMPARAQTPTTLPPDLFADPRLAERFLGDLTTLRTGLSPAHAGVSASSSTSGTVAAAPRDVAGDSWERYLDECAGRVGHPLTRFALGLPLPAGAGKAFLQDLLPVSWDERFIDDIEPTLDEDDAEAVATAADTGVDAAALPDLRRADQEVRHRYRRWVERLVALAPHLGPPERMLVVRLTLWTVAAGAWPPTDSDWVSLLSRAVRALDRQDLSKQVEPQIGSLAAVALAVLRSHAPRYEITPETVAFNEASQAVSHLLPAAESAYVTEYTALLDTAFGPAVDQTAVLDVASDVVQADPVDDAERTLTEKDRNVRRHGQQLLHVTGSFSNPALMALEAVGAAEDAPLVGAWASSDSSNGAWALVIWRRPDLIVVDARRPTTPLWRHHRLTGLVGPRALAAQRSFEAAASVPHGPRNQPFDLALQLLSDLNLPGPQPPDFAT
ncbi:hypothetical protein [Streptomyces violascens]|uniref:PLD phosphodiesterase domain-containing protein n=1 Tax=Streptomyces violascens TaxID=67381 RepID=A0ABQ3QXQ1_9ACTN|nr:hypothetical protein [Streptomyces violascens]GGU18104.1 hypothetical protein GCM10010289_44690 [Streptomyces violascens]GHI42061.1 hypothetical protein Sviol_64690 [Streptomyces violascens]